MYRHAFRFAVGVPLLLAVLAPALAQDKKAPFKRVEEDYRRFFRPPETPFEFWAAMKFEIEVGKFDFAAQHLKGFLDKKPSDEQLLELEEAEGLSAFLRLRNVPKWYDDPKKNAEVKKSVEALIDRVTTALKNRLSDPVRIGKFIRNLNATREERAYAIQQLQRSGPVAMPYVIDALKSVSDPAERVAILTALPRLPQSTVPAMLAALNSDDPNLKVELIDVLLKRGEMSAVPHLWYLHASPKQADTVRRQATAALSHFLATEPGRLPRAKVALAQEAERYYQHKAYRDPNQEVTVWRWASAGKKLLAETGPASKAEEFYGLLFSGQALDLDPTYTPAQNVFLSLALEKGFEQGGLDKPLSHGAPRVKEVLSTVNADLLLAVLQRALKDHRLPVLLGTIQALGDRAEVKAARLTKREPPPLARALNFPDRRVQFAAADALLKIPSRPVYPSRVVEVLRRAVAGEPGARALIGTANPDRGQEIAGALKKAGYDAVVVGTGKDVLRRLNQASDIDVVVIDQAIPDPNLPHLLGQLRADIHYGLLPVFVALTPDKTGKVPAGEELRLNRLVEKYHNVWVVPARQHPDDWKSVLAERIGQSAGKPLTDAERKNQAGEAMNWLRAMAVGEVAGYDIRPAEATILRVLKNDELARLAVETAGRLPGRNPQRELAGMALDPNRPVELRSQAAHELSRHIQQNGVVLAPEQIKGLEALFASNPDPKLKSGVAVVLGTMRPDTNVTGTRLRQYQPTPLPPKKEAPPKKVEPAKEEPGKEK